MINQFHDILPGSSITDVYARTERELGEVVSGRAGGGSRPRGDRDRLGAGAAAQPRPAHRQSGPERRPVRHRERRRLPGGQAAEDGFVLASDTRVPALGVLTGRPTPAIGVSVTARALENAFLRVELGDDGH